MIPFDQLGSSIKEYAKAMAVIDQAREERRRIQAEKRINDSITDAYEQVDGTSGCMEFPR